MDWNTIEAVIHFCAFACSMWRLFCWLYNKTVAHNLERTRLEILDEIITAREEFEAKVNAEKEEHLNAIKAAKKETNKMIEETLAKLGAQWPKKKLKILADAEEKRRREIEQATIRLQAQWHKLHDQTQALQAASKDFVRILGQHAGSGTEAENSGWQMVAETAEALKETAGMVEETNEMMEGHRKDLLAQEISKKTSAPSETAES